MIARPPRNGVANDKTWTRIIGRTGGPWHLPAGGEDIGLLVRFVPDSGLTCDVVAAELRQRLGAHRAPRRVIQITHALPRTGSEKLDRQGVAEMWRSLVSLNS